MNEFFNELKRRNVVRVAIAYAVVSWVVLQLIDVLNEILELPEDFGKAVLVVLGIGFPIVLLISWAYEVTPEGVMKTSEVDKSKSITHGTGQKINKLIIGGLALIVMFFVYDKFIAETPVSFSGGEREASIAVLPFADLSPDASQEYFGDGIAEEILNVLAKNPEMKVAGRTSSFKFKGQNENLQMIADQLNVDHVLEGSVRKDGDKIRVTVQLIAADDGFHLWSETYDRDLVDIFAIQDEISMAVAEAMQVQLGTGEEVVEQHTIANAEAYSIYLRARQFLHARGVENLENAAKLFEAVTVLDPNFDEAYSALTRTLGLLGTYRLGSEGILGLQIRGIEAGKKAIEINPQNAEAYSALSYINLQQLDLREAEKNTLMATTLAPNDAEIANFAGDYFRFVGDFANAKKWEEKALEFDPLHIVNTYDLAFMYYEFGYFEEGLVLAKKAFEMAPDYSLIFQPLVYNLGELGRFDEAREYLAQANENNTPPFLMQEFNTFIAAREGPAENFHENAARLEEMINEGLGGASWLTFHYLDFGDLENGLKWLERSHRDKDPLLITLPKFIPEIYTNDPDLIARFEMPGMKEVFDIRRKNRAEGNGPKQ